MKKASRFYLFRYQIVPLTQNIQGRLDGLIKDYNDLIEKKNGFFFEALSNSSLSFYSDESKINHIIEYKGNDTLMMKVNVRRKEKLGTKDFKDKIEENYPKITVFFNNKKEHQVIAVQHNSKAFAHAETFVNIIMKSLTPYLRPYELGLYIEPLYDINDFWQTIKKYETKITWMRFELIKPNISNISGKIKESFGIISSSTNTHKTTLELQAPDGKTLENLNEQNVPFKTIVDYDLNGGGKQPEIRIGKSKVIHKTLKSQKTFEFQDVQGSAEHIAALFKNITKL